VDKAPDAFRTISEVADEIDVPQHVLRFWESRFREIKPMKRGGGRRYYRPDDVDLLRGIRHLLYGEGYTIRGVQRILKEQGVRSVQALWRAGAPQIAQGPDEEDAALDEAEISLPAPVEGDRGRGLFGLLPALLADDDEEEAKPVPLASAEPHLPLRPVPQRALPVVPPVMPPSVSRNDLRRLQNALQELSECRRLLDAALGVKAQ
jgi:DNA-binding transcriptional MerR regulator